MLRVTRVVIGVAAALLLVGGFVVLVGAQQISGLWSMTIGALAIVALVLERSRYRSEAEERGAGQTGPGGGEPAAPGPPFRRTDELFVDPTTGREMRVYLDPVSGERRYHAEG